MGSSVGGTMKKNIQESAGGFRGDCGAAKRKGVARKRDERGNRSTVGHMKLSKNMCVYTCVCVCVSQLLLLGCRMVYI